MTTRPKVTIEMATVKHHCHLVNRILKRAAAAGASEEVMDALTKRIKLNADPITQEDVFAIASEFLEIERV